MRARRCVGKLSDGIPGALKEKMIREKKPIHRDVYHCAGVCVPESDDEGSDNEKDGSVEEWTGFGMDVRSEDDETEWSGCDQSSEDDSGVVDNTPVHQAAQDIEIPANSNDEHPLESQASDCELSSEENASIGPNQSKRSRCAGSDDNNSPTTKKRRRIRKCRVVLHVSHSLNVSFILN